MKKNCLFFLATCCLVFTQNSYSFQIREKEEIKKTLKFSEPSGQKEEVTVDNIDGSIEVIGYNGSDVQLLVHKTIKGRSAKKIQEAQQKVRLDITEKDNAIILYVDAPYRCRDGSMNYRGWRHHGYKVTFDFELKVPYNTDLYLETINDGEIKVENVNGDYDVKNINGGIEMIGISGSGNVYALNGEVKVVFKKNPEFDSSFGSLNGDVEVSFLPGFSAGLRVKTFNGKVYTDFESTYLAPRKPTRKRKNGMFVYKSDESFGVQVGRGGPEIEFDAFNGNIYIVKQEN